MHEQGSFLRRRAPAKARSDPPSFHMNLELGMTRNATIRYIVREWMAKNSYLPGLTSTKTAMWQDGLIQLRHR
ncbi:hypothetical protein [Rhizobium ruizarguesonis]|uniref:hypothetical protein n=1 Tax=Rhizobium ruizarguesonis TaxID=2081791 RepID=UPI001FE1718B|nr:hypothetical protein [Rhizobium ruizarguesonis]